MTEFAKKDHNQIVFDFVDKSQNKILSNYRYQAINENTFETSFFIFQAIN
jgi:hypothetical protein